MIFNFNQRSENVLHWVQYRHVKHFTHARYNILANIVLFFWTYLFPRNILPVMRFIHEYNHNLHISYPLVRLPGDVVQPARRPRILCANYLQLRVVYFDTLNRSDDTHIQSYTSTYTHQRYAGESATRTNGSVAYNLIRSFSGNELFGREQNPNSVAVGVVDRPRG